MLDLSGLNHAQLEAVVTHEGPLLVLAGAGSGKTRVITHRLAHLISQGIPPHAILCVTFTNKAAYEMKARARHLVGRSLRGATLSTFHALGVRILRRFGHRIGLQPTFGISDAGDQLGVVRQILRRLRIDDRRFDAKKILAGIGWAKNAGLGTEALEEAEIPELVAPDEEYALALVEVYRRYQEGLQVQNVVDFDDLLLRTAELLRAHEDVRAHLSAQWRYVMVDEYQDTNLAQFDVLRRLVEPHHNLCVVGDDDQSIYGWRGADVRNILGFESHFPGAKRVLLDVNYRSTGAILATANAVIAQNPTRFEKHLVAAAEEGEKVAVIAAEGEEDEAEEVANRIVRMEAEGVQLSDVAVLYRSNVQSRPLQMALRHAHLPYRVVGGMDLFDRRELKDALAYLRWLANPQDEQSLRRILNVPPRGIGATAVQRVENWAREEGLQFSEALEKSDAVPELSQRARAAIEGFLRLMAKQRRRLSRVKASTVVKRVLEEVGFEAFLRQASDDFSVVERKVDNVRDLVRQLERFERRRSGSQVVDGPEDDAETEQAQESALDPEAEVETDAGALPLFLSDLALLGLEEAPAPTQEPQQAVTLSTVHAAKGLEWPHVFLVGAEEELLPHRRVTAGEGTVEEERRLVYVAITRARERLTVSYAKNRNRFGQIVPRQPSRFLDDFPEDHVHRWDRGGEERSEDQKEATAQAWRAKIRSQLGLE
ncbi:MAG: UvrD-helicase domain-containing protein [Myxococcota bacterium]